MKFRLFAHKFKCIECDILFLVEKHNSYHASWYTCPQCNGIAEHMDVIMIAEETVSKIKSYSIVSLG